MASNLLTEKAIVSALKKAGASSEASTIKDGDGLTLIVRPDGTGWWRLRCWLSSRENRLSLGTYPDVPLKLARERRDDARKLIAAGTDPSEARKADKAADVARAEAARLAAAGLPGPGTFEHVAREWHAYMAPSWSATHVVKVLALLKNDLIPYIGARLLADLTPPELLTNARRIEARPGELRKAEWSEFDLDGATWTIPSARMKGRLKAKLNGPDHLVPLAPQAVAVLRELHPLTGGGRYVFPNPLTPDRPLSDNGVLSALRRMGFGKDEMTGHGFRATARTIAAERLGIAPEVIEAQLAHRVPDALGRAYNRTQFAEQRRDMMGKWADYLDRLRDGAQVLPFKAA